MDITQDPITSIGKHRGLVARKKLFLAELMIDLSPQRLVSTVFVKASEV